MFVLQQSGIGTQSSSSKNIYKQNVHPSGAGNSASTSIDGKGAGVGTGSRKVLSAVPGRQGPESERDRDAINSGSSSMHFVSGIGREGGEGADDEDDNLSVLTDNTNNSNNNNNNSSSKNSNNNESFASSRGELR